MLRINKQIQREISLLLELRVKNEMAKNAIITEVNCSKDLAQAKVFFTTIDPSIREDVQKALMSAAGLLRSSLGKQMPLRKTPALSFYVDESEEYGRSIDALLDSLKDEEPADGEDGEEQDSEEDEYEE
ncbi:MAG: 30S ribosome-binding factor RbfA [Synergistaceae bacterium]|nr:30S ribosome-binding factor RbfA [Synergistaceae bacterium]